MIQGSLRQGIAVEDLTQLLLAGVLGVGLGLSFAYVPPTYVAVTIASIFLVILAIRSPQYAIIMMVIIQSTIFAQNTFPRLSIGGIHIWITDFIIIGLIGLIIVRLLIDRKTKLFRSPVVLPLLLFLMWVFISSVRGLYFNDNTRDDVIIETRIALYYAMIFCVMYLIRLESGIDFLVRLFYFLAVVAAIFSIIQFALGADVTFLSTGQLYTFSPGGGAEVARVKDTVGEGLVTLALLLKTITMFIDKFRFTKVYDLIQWLILMAGLMTTFNRTHWIMIFLALLIVSFMVGEKERRRLVLWGLVVVFIVVFAGVFIVLTQPDSRAASLINGGVDRVGTLFRLDSYVDPGESTIVWRNFEYVYGIPQIYKNPVFGIGLGGQYRPTLALIDYEGFAGELFTHNSHLWIAMKTGIIGYAFFLWFTCAFFLHALKNWRIVTSIPHRGFVLGSGLGIFVCLLGGNIHPFFMSLEWIPVFSMTIGLSEAIIFYYLSKSEKHV